MGFLAKLFKLTILFTGAFILFMIFYYYYSGLAYLPNGYYQTARSMYGDVGVHDIKNLSSILNRTTLPPCKENKFTPSEAASYLEWYLEGHGFDTYIARSDAIHRIWLIVILDDKSRVAVEPTALCQNTYSPPGIVDDPSGKYRNYSITWREYREKKPDTTYKKFLEEYRFYYNPPKIFDNPGQAVGIGAVIRYPGWKKMKVEDIDWWNSEPFSRTVPFSTWD